MNRNLMKERFVSLFAAIFCIACTNKNPQINVTENTETENNYTLNLNVGNPCNIEFGNVKFTRSVNGAENLIKIDENNRLYFKATEKMDFFCDPDNKISNNTAPILLTEIDNTLPFNFTAKVSPEYTPNGMYNAAVLYIYTNDKFWQKFCFEQDERGKHRIVTVRTIGTSDDNNHDIIEQDEVYLRIFSDTKTIAFYYSLNCKEWQMVRLYKNYYPEKIYLGISNQCPVDKVSYSYFETLSITTDNLTDIRLGN